MASTSSAAAPILSGVTSSSAGSSSNTGNASSSSSPSWNRLWLLFLIPIVLLALITVITVWILSRRRRKRRSQGSALRNVSLVVRDEEKQRDKEERRLSRGNSVRSVLGRKPSMVHDERRKRYTKRLARAGSRSTPAAATLDLNSHNERDPHANKDQINELKTPLGRKASVKHRDQEVAQRVWKVPGELMGERGVGEARSNDIDIEARAAGAGEQDNEELLTDRDSDDEGVFSDRQRVRPPAPPMRSHSRDRKQKQKRKQSLRNQREAQRLSIIGEGVGSDGRRTPAQSRGPSGEYGSLLQSTSAREQDALTRPDTPQDSHSHSATILAAGAAAAAAGLATNSSRSSAHSDETSRPVRAQDTEATMARERVEGGEVTLPAAAATADEEHAGEEEEEGPPSAISTSEQSHASNPFASPSTSDSPIDSSGRHSASNPPAITISNEAASQSVMPASAASALAETERSSTPANAGSSLSSKLSSIVRLKTPTPRRDRSASPMSASPRSLSRTLSQNSASSRQRPSTPSGTGKTSGRLGAPRLVRGFSSSHDPTSSPAQSSSLPQESWAYTSRAAEWKRDRGAINVSADSMPNQSTPALPSTFTSPLRPSSSDDSSEGPVVQGERVWLSPEPSEVGASAPTAAPTGESQPQPQSQSQLQSQSQTQTQTGSQAPNKTEGVERKPSIGVKGSRFKESFE